MNETANSNILLWLRKEFQPQRLLPALVMGTITGTIEVIRPIASQPDLQR